MIVLLFILPILATTFALVTLVPYLVWRADRVATAPYTPDLDAAEAWAAELDVALGESWLDAPAPTPKALVAKRSMVTPRTMRCAITHAPMGEWMGALAPGG